jgi:hypothetical protein
LARRSAGVTGPLPDVSPAPTNAMQCSGLKELGLEFGGWPLFEETIADLVTAAAHAEPALA